MRQRIFLVLASAALLGLLLGPAARSPFPRLEAAAEGDLVSRARAARSQTEGRIQLHGLDHAVTVLRDSWGVPHIYAETQHDLFFAQGFVAAQDRLFQMELWKRAGQGRLAEVLGPAFLARDIKARLLRYRGPTDAEFASYSSDTREILQAFTQGINAEIKLREAPEGRGLDLEFQLAGFRPEPWKPEDCLMRMAGFPMTGNSGSELRNAQLVARLGAQKAARLLALDPPVALDPAPGLDFAGLSPALLRDLVGSDTRVEFPPEVMGAGSNNWVVAGALTRTGRPILANDPHRTVALPSLRYIVHLVAPGWNVIGAGEPALPGVAVGHNERIAWGFTVFGLDQQDLYVEELDPSDPLRYRTEAGWQQMRVEPEELRIRGQKPETVSLKFTRHGPVLWEDQHRALALRWVGAEPGTAGYLASLAVDRARSWGEFLAAMERWKVPSENIVYADTAGNIGEQSAGLAPWRRNWTGLLPVSGAGGLEWAGFVPTRALPRRFNPPPGFIVTANQRMISEGYQYKVGFEWAPPYRAQRIREVLAQASDAGHKLDLEDMAGLQNDVVSLPARELLRLLATAGALHDDSTQRFLKWNGEVRSDSAPATLYELWLQELEREVYHRLAPKDAWDLVEGHRSLPVVLNHLNQPDAETFGADPRAARDALLRETLAVATEKLRRLLGPDPNHWAWGKLHQMLFRHPLDRFPGSASLFDPEGPIPRPGDGTTVNATGSTSRSFEQVSGASYREIFDVGDWDRSLAVNVPGQSGQPGSPHYFDLAPLWVAGKYFPLVYSREAAEREARERLVLEPAP